MIYSRFMKENNDEYYKQIFDTDQNFIYERHLTIKINLSTRIHLFVLIFLNLTLQTKALPISQGKDNQPSNVSNIPSLSSSSYANHIQSLTATSTYSQLQKYKIYRHVTIPSYLNGALVQVNNKMNLLNQQQLKRERYRRKMIEKLFLQFDDDGNGQLSNDELYSLSLRLNIFPKFYQFLKNASLKP